jgi:hypothetical protein
LQKKERTVSGQLNSHQTKGDAWATLKGASFNIWKSDMMEI